MDNDSTPSRSFGEGHRQALVTLRRGHPARQPASGALALGFDSLGWYVTDKERLAAIRARNKARARRRHELAHASRALNAQIRRNGITDTARSNVRTTREPMHHAKTDRNRGMFRVKGGPTEEVGGLSYSERVALIIPD